MNPLSQPLIPGKSRFTRRLCKMCSFIENSHIFKWIVLIILCVYLFQGTRYLFFQVHEERVMLSQAAKETINMVMNELKCPVAKSIINDPNDSETYHNLGQPLSRPSHLPNDSDSFEEKNLPFFLSGTHVAAIIKVTKPDAVVCQIQALREQSVQIHHIWVAGTKEQLQYLYRYLWVFPEVHTFYIRNELDPTWIVPLIQSNQADYTFVMDCGIIPDAHFAEYYLGVAMQSELQNAVIGTQGGIVKLQDQLQVEEVNWIPEQPLIEASVEVDFLTGMCLVPKIWLESWTYSTIINLEISNIVEYLSSALHYHISAPLHVVPIGMHNILTFPFTFIDQQSTQSLFNNRNWELLISFGFPSVYYRQLMSTMNNNNSIVFFLPSIHHFEKLEPLLMSFRCSPHDKFYVVGQGLKKKVLRLHSIVYRKSLIKGEGRCEGKAGNVTLREIAPPDSKYFLASSRYVIDNLEHVKVAIQLKDDKNYESQVLATLFQRNRNATVISISDDSIPSSLWLPTLSVESLKNWNKPKLSIVILANDRPRSLQRLLTSISNGKFLGDIPDITIHLDTGADEEVFAAIDQFNWPKQHLNIRHRTKNAGIFGAVTESWFPSSDDEYALFLEDDIEVAPAFYSWSKYTLLQYRYGEVGQRNASLFGISLYSPRFAEITSKKDNFFVEEWIPLGLPYLFQLPCSWGAIYFPEHWREFHRFLKVRPDNLTKIPDVRSNTWSRSWKRFFIEMVYMKGYVMLYPNFGEGLSFSTNRVERGEHFHTVSATMKERYMMPLYENVDFTEKLYGRSLPTWEKLPVFSIYHVLDYLFHLKDVGKTFMNEEKFEF